RTYSQRTDHRHGDGRRPKCAKTRALPGCWGVVLDFFHPLRGSPGLKLSVTFPAVLPSVRFFADSSPRRGSQ
ncbi:hypothetical protein GBC45_09570, partial [Bifidobacterium longum]